MSSNPDKTTVTPATLEAVFNTSEFVEVSPDLVADLKRRALQAPRGRFRICLHHDLSDKTHEMIIALHRATPFMPHRHPAGKSESLHIIEGRMRVFFFNDHGVVVRSLDMGDHASGQTFMYRLSEPVWHMPVALTEWSIHHEVYTGPFERTHDTTVAPWAPQETDVAGWAAFLARLGISQ